MGKKIRYGRGTFEAHPNYVRYMEMIVAHPSYAGMPGARQAGRIMWQVSSGKTTSFYKHYVERFGWWAAKADALNLPGEGNSEERFSIAARRIHPTGYRPCRLCGVEWNVGYFYLNYRFAGKLNKQLASAACHPGEPIGAALDRMRARLPEGEVRSLLSRLFPERVEHFRQYGYTVIAFERSNDLRSTWLSPGFMCNPPDRLDGFHDYCLGCRGEKDPGRSKENLRSYAHDRRAFEWWAEGDWMLADVLYNSAGAGICDICRTDVDRVSPDHPGPLACGFKHLALFIPTCQRCNSAKNRRMRVSDVVRLRAYESESGESTASWHVRAVWDTHKRRVQTDEEAKALSTAMREVQHHYLTVLHSLLELGHARFLSTLLRPEHAYHDIELRDLDPGALTFTSYTKTQNRTPLRESLARRSVRIGFDELRSYAGKSTSARKVSALYRDYFNSASAELLRFAKSVPLTRADREWVAAVDPSRSVDEREKMIGDLLKRRVRDAQPTDDYFRRLLEELFAGAAKLPLSLK